MATVLRVLRALLFVSGLAWPSESTAQGAESIQLTWNAPEGCSSSGAVLARVRQIAGSNLALAPLQAEATISRFSDGPFRMQLVIRAGALVATRWIDGNSCADLVGAAAVALSVALSSMDPVGENGPSANASGNANSPGAGDQTAQQRPERRGQALATSDPSVPSTTTEPADVERPPRRWKGLLRLPLASLGVGPLSQPSLGLGLAAGAAFDRWQMFAEGRLWASQHLTKRDLLDDYGADLSRLTISLRGCRSVWGSRFEISPCALLSLQHLTARGTGPHIVSRGPESTWLAAGVGVQARLSLAPWFGLVLSADGEVQLSRPQINLEGIGTVGRLAPAAATVTVGSEWIL